MNVFSMVVAIVALGVCGGVMREYFRSRRRPPADDGLLEEAEQRIAHLEERVLTLERIITDPKTSLRHTIDNL